MIIAVAPTRGELFVIVQVVPSTKWMQKPALKLSIVNFQNIEAKESIFISISQTMYFVSQI